MINDIFIAWYIWWIQSGFYACSSFFFSFVYEFNVIFHTQNVIKFEYEKFRETILAFSLFSSLVY